MKTTTLMLAVLLTAIVADAQQSTANRYDVGRAGDNAAGPRADDPISSSAQRNSAVSIDAVPQVQPLSPYVARPEHLIEHEVPWQPPQPELVPAIKAQLVEDTLPSFNTLAPNTSGLLQSFQGLAATGWFPPDPIIAAGPNHLIVGTNSSWSIYSKSGSRLYSTTFEAWFSKLNPPSHIFDPKIVYDANAGRWIVFALAKDNSAHTSYYLISVSGGPDPTAGWWGWIIDAGLNGTSQSDFWADYPGLGYDSNEAVYITSNQWDFSADCNGHNCFHYAKMRILYKQQLYWVGSGSSLSWWDFWGTSFLDADGANSFTVKPAQAGSTLNGQYLIDTRPSGGSAITLWRLTNPLGSPPSLVRQATVAIGGVNGAASYSLAPDASQFGGADRVDVGPCQTQEVSYRNGKLATAFTEKYNWGSGDVAVVRTLVVDAVSSGLELNQSFGADGLWYFYPAIIRDNAGSLAMVFNRSGSSEYANCRYTVQLTSDSQWESSASLKTGEGYYQQYDSDGRNRWGDYSGAALDPADTSKAWIYSEYASTGNQWSTWVGQFQLNTYLPKPDFNHDGKSDVLWQNNVSGDRVIWLMNGNNKVGESGLPSGSGSTAWRIMTIGDFNGDGNLDIVWQNGNQRTVWLMNGASYGTETGLPPGSSTDWQIAGSGDFNGDGQLDIVWQNVATGARTIWLMTGTNKTGEIPLPVNLPPVPKEWEIVGTADFDGDGHVDLLWQKKTTGQRTIWLMNGNNKIGEAGLPSSSDVNWVVAGTGDFNQDGLVDIIFQHTISGARTIWLMNKASYGSETDLKPQGISANWEIRNH